MSAYAQEEVPEVVLAFREALEDLQRNDQYEIENLTMIAKEATEHAQAISNAVETHVRKTRPEYKLPGLYLLDSLVKHIGTPYTVYLSRDLYKTFFDAYTVVDTNTRRAMDELVRSWMQPVPESRDPKPVFPPEVTQPIDAALQKIRSVSQRPPSVSQPHRMHPLPARVTSVPAPVRTHTPNGQYGYQPPLQPPHGYAPPPNMTPQPQQPYLRSPAPQVQPPSVAMALPPSNMPPYGARQAPTPVQYVYSGPPPPTMSHQERLGKLRYDVQGLLDSVRAHLSMYPHDQEKLKLQSNLQSLKTLLDGGSLSLTHIQSTEIVVANIARDLPFRPPTAQPAPPPPQPAPAPPTFDPSMIASILARNTPQPMPTQPYAPPAPPAVSTPQFASAFPAAAPTQQNLAGIDMSQIMSMLKPPAPAPSASTPSASIPPAASSLLDRLRASGILAGTPTPATPVQPPAAAASILSQLMQPQPGQQYLNDCRLDAASLKVRRPHLIRQLYEDKPDQCRQCGMRFPGTDHGKKAKGVHIDWHFKVNTRVEDSRRNAINRSWYIDERDWIGYREELSGYSGIVTISSAHGSAGGNAKKEVKEQFVFVPTDARLVNMPCPICQERFEQGWDEATQQPTWKDAVKVGSKYYHASCFAEVSKGAAAAANTSGAGAAATMMERTASSSARSTPDAVLGKRRYEDFRVDSSTAG